MSAAASSSISLAHLRGGVKEEFVLGDTRFGGNRLSVNAVDPSTQKIFKEVMDGAFNQRCPFVVFVNKKDPNHIYTRLTSSSGGPLHHPANLASIVAAYVLFPGQQEFSPIASDAAVNRIPDYLSTLLPFEEEPNGERREARSKALVMIANELMDNPEKALPWLLTAAESGSPEAQNGLGVFYQLGIGGIEVSQLQAETWFTRAAEQGYAEAKYNLGVLYASQEKLEEAKGWYQQAADQDYPQAKYNLAILLSASGEEENGRVLGLLRGAAYAGVPQAQVRLGDIYEHGTHGVEANPAVAVGHYRLAADRGFAEAQYRLGRCYRYGIGVEQNVSEALKHFKSALDGGYEPARGAYNTTWYLTQAQRIPSCALM